MERSTLNNSTRTRLHVAILMDGNGRWAASHGWPRSAGHCAGVDAVRRVLRAAPESGIGTLTLYAFSSDNWQRPEPEVATLLGLLEDFLITEAERCAAHGVRVRVIGRRDRLSRSLIAAIEAVEKITASGRMLDLRIAVDYSARDAILRAACWMLSSLEITQREFARLLGTVTHSGGPVPDVDLVIRTGGERRLSDFLLWESAYAELVFTSKMWPDFTAEDLKAAVQEFSTRERRFGRVPDAPAEAPAPILVRDERQKLAG
jgi:undecaprenyl diphosphate synthase